MNMSMNIASLIIANIRFRPLSAAFNILLLALGVAVLLIFGHLNTALQDRFNRDLNGIDLVIGGKGSPLQIILSSVFHIDTPTGNIPMDQAMEIAHSRLIAKAIPLALGDNFSGFRIVGTTADYIGHYKGRLAQGVVFDTPMEAVLGSDVAQKTGRKIGDRVVGAHGLSGASDLHKDTPYTVTGILAPTGTVLDRLVLTPVESVWAVHHHEEEEHEHEHAHEQGHEDHGDKELTALLLTYKTPLAAMQLPRRINAASGLQAASPAVEMARLYRLMGTGRDLMSVFAVAVTIFAGFGLFISLTQALHDRLYDMTLLRVMGASRSRIAGLIFGEAFGLALAGLALGILLSQAALALIAANVMETRHLDLTGLGVGVMELWVSASVLLIALLAALFPAIRVYRLNISDILAKA
jgi:putative ABC transport system permease protein